MTSRRKARKRQEGEIRCTINWPPPDGSSESAKFIGLDEVASIDKNDPPKPLRAIVERSYLLGFEDESDRTITVPLSWLTFHGPAPKGVLAENAENAGDNEKKGELQ